MGKMYLIIDAQYRIYKKDFLSGKIRRLAKDGELSVINLKTMEGLNRSDSVEGQKEEWSKVQELPDGFGNYGMKAEFFRRGSESLSVWSEQFYRLFNKN